MAKVTVKIVLDGGRIGQLKLETNRKAANKAAKITADRAKANLAANGSVVTGKLYHSIKPRTLNESNNRVDIAVGADQPYAKYVEKGRGPVIAKPGKTLAFRIGRGGPLIFRRSVGPAKGVHFLRNASRMLSARDFYG